MKIDGLTEALLSTLNDFGQRMEQIEKLQMQLIEGLQHIDERVAQRVLSASPSGILALPLVAQEKWPSAQKQKPLQVSSLPEQESTERTPSPTNPSPTNPFPKLPPELRDVGLSKEESLRQSAIYELFTTEADYIRDLQVIINVCSSSPRLLFYFGRNFFNYHSKVFQTDLLRVFPMDEVTKIFSNIRQILDIHLVNCTLLSSLIFCGLCVLCT
jgi:hypothetical protein